MQKQKFRNPSKETCVGLDISSLVDVSFLLLIYFLITSTLDPQEADLGMELGGLPSSHHDFIADPIELSIDANGIVSMFDEVLESNPERRHLIHLEDRLATWLAAQSINPALVEPTVQLTVDDDVRGQRFIDVVNCLAKFEIDHVSLVDFDR